MNCHDVCGDFPVVTVLVRLEMPEERQSQVTFMEKSPGSQSNNFTYL
jgi:hypothetical protein